MDKTEKIFSLLKTVTVDCKDNGKEFLVTDRITAIECLLKGTSYNIVAREPLALLFAKRMPQEGEKALLISSHIDCVYSSCFCNDCGEFYKGTFDNSLGNAAVLWCMINGMLPENAVVAFTGDEERDSNGAVQTLLALGRMDCTVSAAIVLDVTNEGWDSGALFAIENDSGFDLLQAYNIISSLRAYSSKLAFRHNAEPDESWDLPNTVSRASHSALLSRGAFMAMKVYFYARSRLSCTAKCSLSCQGCCRLRVPVIVNMY